MPESRYMTGYNGTVRTKAELLAWSHWQNLDAEYQRRALAIIDASLTAGRPRRRSASGRSSVPALSSRACSSPATTR